VNIEQSIRSIAAKSSVKFLDIAAGDFDGQKLRVRHTGDVALSLNSDVAPSEAADLNDRRYLIASITKPIVAMAAVQLAADGWFALNDPVRDLLPGFNRGPLRQITVRHLLTHTSGLPDMLPQNQELRIAYAGTQDFVNATTEVTPDFAAGTDCRYSSMGFAVLAAIIESIAQTTCANHLLQTVFQPLGHEEFVAGSSF
jgi:CubicO group peptidase (beta-lactamase class C family)